MNYYSYETQEQIDDFKFAYEMDTNYYEYYKDEEFEYSQYFDNIENAEIVADYKEILLDGVNLLVNEDGEVFRKNKNFKSLDWRIIENVANYSGGYNQIRINKKIVRRHRIIAYAFLGLDITNLKIQVDHIDGDRLNNCLANLRLVNNQQNHFNRTTAKGYTKNGNKFQAYIKLNGKRKCLGTYVTKEEAHQKYLDAKKIYHIID